MLLMNEYAIVAILKYVIIKTYISNKMKNLRFQKPMQLLIQGQWWSMFKTQRLHAEQWWQRSGLKILHIKQYRLLLFSGSPRWKPQNTGTCPGSVVIAYTKDQTSMIKNTWKIASKASTLISSEKCEVWLLTFKSVWVRVLHGLRTPD